ncbi:MAG: hypothetical protein WCV00_22650 [Verrucomicrobiia bacterium]
MSSEHRFTDWAVLTPGGTQLLTAIALLRMKRIPADLVEVFSFFPRHDALMSFVERVSALFGLRYGGVLDDYVRFFLGKKEVVLKPSGWKWFWTPESYSRQAILRLNSHLKRIQRKSLIMAFKPYDDLSLLLCGLNYPNTIFIADGAVVFGGFAEKQKDWTWRGVRNIAAEIPLSEPIYGPSYLRASSERFGIPADVPDEILLDCYERLMDLPETRRARDLFETRESPAQCALVLGQNLSPVLAHPFQDVEYYSVLIRDLAARGFRHIVYKPHPRDEEAKSRIIRDLVRSDSANLCMMSSDEACVPVEALSRFVCSRGWTAFGACSSALSGCQDHMQMKVSCVTSSILPLQTRNIIAEFAARHKFGIHEIG